MNLLVTNTRNAQAYAIIRALRPYAQKVVATMEGGHRLAARLSHAANSRLVDKRYYTPSPAKDWRAGKIQRENTETEEAYIQAVLRICEQEKIDTIFPSFDPHMYVFSKNRDRFEKTGVLIPVPDYEIVITPLDKYRTIQVAQEVGFPCPKTYLPRSEDDLKKIADELGFPMVIKPCFTSAGRGMRMVGDFQALLENVQSVCAYQTMPMVQEYIPGKQNQNYYLVLDRKGDWKSVFCATNLYPSRVAQALASAGESIAPNDYVQDAIKLVRRLGWWGGATLQVKIDSRDGIPKLMEINPRLGVNLWYRTELGINVPWMCVNIARRQDITAVKNYPVEMILIDPIASILELGFDVLDLLFYKIRIGIQNKSPIDPSNPPMALYSLMHCFLQPYLNDKKKIFNPYFRYFFRDPRVSVIWYLQFLILILRQAKQLGR
jgi:biotin carboxylase